MDVLLKAIAGAFISIVLYHAIAGQRSEIALLLSIAACCMIGIAAFTYLQPVVDFFSRLQTLGQLNSDMMTILLKAIGVGLISEITSLICKDLGNDAIGKVLQMLATAVILYISLPMFDELLTMIESVLGKV